MIKIGLIGVQGAGKTTTTYGIAHELKADGYTVNVVMEAAREAADRNMPINSGTNASTQIWILDRHELKELEAERKPTDFLVTDRSVLDGLPYTKLYIPEFYESIKDMALAYFKVKPYSLLLHFRPLAGGPENDGVRDSSTGAQIAVTKAFDEVLDELNLPSSLLYHVKSGDKRKRLQEVMKVIHERFPMKPAEELHPRRFK